MIPKIIHYCWFGPNKIPEELMKFIKTWKLFCPDYEIKLWNEESFDINSQIFTQTAYFQKKYAFVSDYVRAYALYNEGGIYLDTDVQLKESLDVFLENEAFTCFESENFPFTSAVWGTIPNHSFTKKMLNYYYNRSYSFNEPTNVFIGSNILTKDFNINSKENYFQIGDDSINSIHIYPSSHFCLDLPKNYATHHFYGSWIKDTGKSFKTIINEKYLIESIQKEQEICLSKDFLKAVAKNLSFGQLLKLIVYFLRKKNS